MVIESFRFHILPRLNWLFWHVSHATLIQSSIISRSRTVCFRSSRELSRIDIFVSRLNRELNLINSWESSWVVSWTDSFRREGTWFVYLIKRKWSVWRVKLENLFSRMTQWADSGSQARLSINSEVNLTKYITPVYNWGLNRGIFKSFQSWVESTQYLRRLIWSYLS